MAKFVLAGKADCPRYAEAELLADCLQRSLPDFRVNKIPVLPDEWQEWLHKNCAKNGWEHKESPIIWRELVDQGGKGMLLGGFHHFIKHCLDYYNVTLKMDPDELLSIAAENLATKLYLAEEQRRHLSLMKPLQIWISGALTSTCQFLIRNLFSTEVFPEITAINLHLLDVQGNEEELALIKMETESLAPPLLHKVTFYTNLDHAFKNAEVIIILDGSDDDVKRDEKEKKLEIKQISERYKEYGSLIDTRASREVKVIVSSGSFVNLRCSLLLSNVHSIDNSCFVTMATQLENEARAVIANTLRVWPSDITNVIVWGNVNGSYYIDLQKANVHNYRGPIRGPYYFSRPALEIFLDRKWLEIKFQDLVRFYHKNMSSKTHKGAAMSVANGITTILKAWNGTPGPDTIFSIGVVCSGCYDLPDGTILSAPVTFTDGKWSLVLDVTIDDELKRKIKVAAREVAQELEALNPDPTEPESVVEG